MLAVKRRVGALLTFLLCCLCVALIVHVSHFYPSPSSTQAAQLLKASGTTSNSSTEGTNFHLLLPATDNEVNLCKTLLTTTILDYPVPILIAWKQAFDNTDGLLGGGSHVAKISGVLEYLKSMDPSTDGDLVLMVDAYGMYIWFQLPFDVLISRYHAINAAANDRLRSRLGRAVDAEDLRQTIIFGAGKRCAPNQVHTVACYPIPDSPLPDDLYGNNTDTIMGRNKYTSLKQRYLNSGFIMGPVKDMRALFQRAQEKIAASVKHPEWDNGSNGADFMYHGSDQSIFNIILGEQEFQREVMRRRHKTEEDEIEGIAPNPPPTWIEGTLIDDPLNPKFTHETMENKAGRPDEFGVGLDYFSELGQQTVNAEEDCQWIRYNQNVEDQLAGRHGLFDCPPRVEGRLPNDILKSQIPFQHLVEDESLRNTGWAEIPLYTNVCLDKVPVMIHHNGNKDARQFAWPNLWIQPYARRMFRDKLATKGDKVDGKSRAALANGIPLAWDDLCPQRMDAELYREV